MLPDVVFLRQIDYFLMLMAGKNSTWHCGGIWLFLTWLLAEMADFMALKRSPRVLHLSSEGIKASFLP